MIACKAKFIDTRYRPAIKNGRNIEVAAKLDYSSSDVGLWFWIKMVHSNKRCIKIGKETAEVLAY